MYFKIFFIGLSFCLLTSNTFLSNAQAREPRKKLPPITVSTVMNSTAQEVWDAMMDFENYGDWNRWVVKLEGDAKLGGKVRAYNEQGISLKLKITSIEAPYKICWVDVTWFTHFGLGGWRCRSIEVLPDNQGIKFTNHFEFTGIFGGALAHFTRKMLKEGMELENESLRTFVEM